MSLWGDSGPGGSEDDVLDFLKPPPKAQPREKSWLLDGLVGGLLREEVDYKTLYFVERDKNRQLEQLVRELETRIASLQREADLLQERALAAAIQRSTELKPPPQSSANISDNKQVRPLAMKLGKQSLPALLSSDDEELFRLDKDRGGGKTNSKPVPARKEDSLNLFDENTVEDEDFLLQLQKSAPRRELSFESEEDDEELFRPTKSAAKAVNGLSTQLQQVSLAEKEERSDAQKRFSKPKSKKPTRMTRLGAHRVLQSKASIGSRTDDHGVQRPQPAPEPSATESAPLDRRGRTDSFWSEDSEEDWEAQDGKQSVERSSEASVQSVSPAPPSELDAEAVNRLVLQWARSRRDMLHLLLSVQEVYAGELPDLSKLLPAPPQTLDPSDSSLVRRLYLNIVRYCHPDKQQTNPSALVRLQTAMVFQVLSEAYAAYKAAQEAAAGR